MTEEQPRLTEAQFEKAVHTCGFIYLVAAMLALSLLCWGGVGINIAGVLGFVMLFTTGTFFVALNFRRFQDRVLRWFEHL